MKDDVTSQPTGLSPALRAQDGDQLQALINREIEGPYRTPELRAAYRAGMSTSAAICDAVGATFGAKPDTLKRLACKNIAHGCGDEIMRLRQLINVHEPRGLSAADEPCSEGVTPISPDPTTGGKG